MLLLLAVVVAALLLPLATILVAFLPRAPQAAKAPPAAEPEGLRERLEQLASQELAPPGLETSQREWRIMVPEPVRAARHIEEFARDLGGVTVSSEPSRVLVSVPPQNLNEFFRRVSLLTGAVAPAEAGPEILAIEFVRQDAPASP